MRYQDIPTILKETGLPVTYYAWPEDDLQHPVPDLPELKRIHELIQRSLPGTHTQYEN